MSCKVCLMEIKPDEGGCIPLRLCGPCYEQLHAIRDELREAGMKCAWEELTARATTELKIRFRKGALKPMKKCSCCGEMVHTYADNAAARKLMLCTMCHAIAHKKWLESDDKIFTEIVEEMRGTAYTESELDETLDIVKVNRERITEPGYRDLEYDFLNLDVLEFENERDELNVLNQLMDAALLGNDIEWAKSLHKQIQALKGENAK